MRSAEQVEQVRKLAAAGLNQSAIARTTGIPRSTLRYWLGDGRRRPSMCCVCAGDPDRLPDHDYTYLLGLYLGDGTLSRYPRDVFQLRVSCAEVYPGIMAECENAMRAVLGSRVGRVRAKGCVHVYAYSKHWPCLFPQHGPGRKHARRIELADWQRRLVFQDPRPLLRGLLHSDGCRVLNRAVGSKYPAYPRYHFSNRSTDIRRIFGEACDAIGIEWRHNNATNISIARRGSVAILDAFVGPKN